jgi:hypothetical protein
MVVEFSEDVERNRLAYSEKFRFAAAIGKEWKTVASQEVKSFYDALMAFGAGSDTMISAYQAEQSARKIIRETQKRSAWQPDEIRNSGVAIHLLVSRGLWEQGIANFVAVGNVRTDGVDVWTPTLESLRGGLMINRDSSVPFDAHAWISFPDMSIIDATWWFHEHRTNLPKKYSWPDRIIAGEPVRGAIRYEPMVIGTQFAAPALALPLHLH